VSKEAYSSDETARFAEDLIAPDTQSLSPEESAAVAALPADSALLIVRRGPGAGSRFLLDQDVTVAGRHPNADIFLDDVTVSRKHVEFVRTGNGFEIRDLGSMNGTYVDGDRVDGAPLYRGAEVLVGKFRMTFYASPSERA
jgi:pSer/pThr/pTyr-binding forkhead associated (FHA) protein